MPFLLRMGVWRPDNRDQTVAGALLSEYVCYYQSARMSTKKQYCDADVHRHFAPEMTSISPLFTHKSFTFAGFMTVCV